MPYPLCDVQKDTKAVQGAIEPMADIDTTSGEATKGTSVSSPEGEGRKGEGAGYHAQQCEQAQPAMEVV